MIVLVDFGSQTTHLIGRRLNELGQKVKIISPEQARLLVTHIRPKGIILSGGPSSVYEKGSPTIDPSLFNLGIPILGICYGLQLIAHLLGGHVVPGVKKEFGPALCKVSLSSPLFQSTPQNPFQSSFTVWMSHGDMLRRVPHGFVTIGKTPTTPYAAIAHENKKIYGIQFHPEVIHTQYGIEIFKNFIHICRLSISEKSITHVFVDNLVNDIKDSVKQEKTICALSGGVDSSVAALLVHKAIGDRLHAIYIDSGLMRQHETAMLKNTFKTHYHMKVKVIQAGTIFLKNLNEVTDPEKKRHIIGKTFIQVLEKEAEKIGARFLIQGTIYSDVIESAGTKKSSKIKSHHNVAGLPRDMKLTLVEPLRNLYKDEVRKIGVLLKLPPEIIHRQPFPGPGLAIRIIGEVTQEKLNILRLADTIVQEEVQNTKLRQKLWQAFAVYTGIKTTGARGDRRSYGDTIAIRAVEADDAMTASWARLPYPLLNTISTRIVNEISQVNRVVYDITNKPPGTMEWE